jgi:hypothetical protein
LLRYFFELLLVPRYQRDFSPALRQLQSARPPNPL